MTLFQIKHKCFPRRYRQCSCYWDSLSCPYIRPLRESLGDLPVTVHVQVLVIIRSVHYYQHGSVILYSGINVAAF